MSLVGRIMDLYKPAVTQRKGLRRALKIVVPFIYATAVHSQQEYPGRIVDDFERNEIGLFWIDAAVDYSTWRNDSH